jgi:hypothetical protein
VRARVALLIAAGLVASVGAALATAEPRTPPDGSVIDSSRPTFAWALGPGDESRTISVATPAEFTSTGSFIRENTVLFAELDPDDTTWQSEESLPAGRYFWHVETRNATAPGSPFSETTRFTIRPFVQIVGVTSRRVAASDDLRIAIRWRSNARRVTVTATLDRAGTTVWKAREISGIHPIARETLSAFDWIPNARIPEGTRLRLEVTVAGAGKTTAAVRTVLAP